jgi:hypothetical protein
VFFLQVGLCLKIEAFNGGGVFLSDINTIMSQCGTAVSYTKLSEYDGHTTTDMTYTATSSTDWSGVIHFIPDATVVESSLNILQNGLGSSFTFIFELEIRVPVTKGCATDTPSLVPSNNPSVLPSLLPSTFPSTLPSLFPTVPPSRKPSSRPSVAPSNTPSFLPSNVPSILPTNMPSWNAGNLNDNDMYFVSGLICIKVEFRSGGLIEGEIGNPINCNGNGFQSNTSLSQFDNSSGNKIYYTTAGSSYPYSGVFTIKFSAAVTDVKVTLTVQGTSFNALVQFPSDYTITSGADIAASTT